MHDEDLRNINLRNNCLQALLAEQDGVEREYMNGLVRQPHDTVLSL